MVVRRVLGWFAFLLSARKDVYNIRKKYDEIREDMVRKKKTQRTLQILRLLDQLEPQIITLEEQDLHYRDRRKMILFIKTSLKDIKEKSKKVDKKIQKNNMQNPQRRR